MSDRTKTRTVELIYGTATLDDPAIQASIDAAFFEVDKPTVRQRFIDRMESLGYFVERLERDPNILTVSHRFANPLRKPEDYRHTYCTKAVLIRAPSEVGDLYANAERYVLETLGEP